MCFLPCSGTFTRNLQYQFSTAESFLVPLHLCKSGGVVNFVPPLFVPPDSQSAEAHLAHWTTKNEAHEQQRLEESQKLIWFSTGEIDKIQGPLGITHLFEFPSFETLACRCHSRLLTRPQF